MKVAQLCLTLCDPMNYIVYGILQARILEGVAFPLSRDLPNPRIGPSSPTLQADSLPAELQGKTKNTGVGSLSLLQWIFPTQESNQDLLHCRRILYQLNYEGSISLAPLKITKTPYICVSILYWCFSFWLTSLCIMGSSFIHLIRAQSNVFFLMAE